jgi:hypothetical protein
MTLIVIECILLLYVINKILTFIPYSQGINVNILSMMTLLRKGEDYLRISVKIVTRHLASLWD